MTEIQVHKHAAMIPMSREAIEEARQDAEAFYRYMNATDAEREQWAREAAERRAAERAATQRVPLSLDALLDKLGWSLEYAEHVVQPYCTCGDSSDGWDYCRHARDEGLMP
jgi:formiminotetrahydrofolate cyclodeaminase